MKKIKMSLPACLMIAFIGFLLLFSGCATQGPMEQRMPMDSAAHHVHIGNQFAQSGDAQQALAQFNAALRIDPDYSAAHAGKARVYAVDGDYEKALVAANKAIRHADGHSEKINARLAKMDVLSRSDADFSLREIEKDYRYIVNLAPNHPEATILMAGAYARVDETQKADRLYAALVEQGGPQSAKAAREWESMQARKRLESDVRATEELADLPQLTRAQTAALMAESLKGTRLIRQRRENIAEAGFRTPAQMRESRQTGGQDLPPDVVGHPLEKSLSLVLELRLRGLSAMPDGRFYPNNPMSRADMALSMEDLLIIAENNPALASRFVGSASPFVDVSADAYSFNAILLNVSRGIMAAPEDRRFQPEMPVSGMDALRSIQKVRPAFE